MERPSTQSRMNRPPTGSVMSASSQGSRPSAGSSVSGPPGTASGRGQRLGTAQGARIGTGAGSPAAHPGAFRPGTGMAPPMAARPLTQQGLGGGIKTATTGGRQVQDATYFFTKLNEKKSQVLAMNAKLRRDVEEFEKNRGRFAQMAARQSELLAEVKRLEAQLLDYNLVIQQSTMQASAADVQRTIANTQDETRLVQSRLKDVNKARLRLERQAEDVAEQLARVEEELELQLSQLTPEARQAYSELQMEVRQLGAESARMEQDSQALAKRVMDAQTAIARNPVKQQALQLQTALLQLEAEKAREQEEFNRLVNPRASCEALASKMQRDQNELTTLKNQIKDVQDQIKAREASIGDLRGGGGDDKAEMREKFQSLLDKEREVNAFLDGFERARREMQDDLSARALEVRELLASITKLGQLHAAAAPDAEQLQQVKDELEYKRAQKDNSAETTVRLEENLKMRQEELVKIDSLEDKMTTEVASISERLAALKAELAKFEALDALAAESEARRDRLKAQQAALSQRADLLSSTAEAKAKHVQAKGEQLQAASWYQDFREVEERLRKAAGISFQLSESIKQKETESNFAPIVDSIKAMLVGLNEEVIRAV